MSTNSGDAAAKRPDGRPRGTPFQRGQSGNPKGRAKGSVSLSTRIKRILEGDETLPETVREEMLKAAGQDKKALDALILVGLLNGLKGDKAWAQLLLEHGYGKPIASVALTDPDGAPAAFTLKIDNS